MFFQVDTTNPGIQGPGAVSIRCPACKQRGTLDSIINANDVVINVPGKGAVSLGQRRCPNPTCHKHVFVAFQGGKVLFSYPPERLDFDSTDIPDAVKAAFEEAIACHSQQSFVASAMMVRKTLEELCRHKGAEGENLKQRIQALGDAVVLPKELLQGADDLRLLGNDAAHIESRQYEKVGKEEVELAIEFAKELLKAVYQYSSLLDKLRALKKARIESGEATS